MYVCMYVDIASSEPGLECRGDEKRASATAPHNKLCSSQIKRHNMAQVSKKTNKCST